MNRFKEARDKGGAYLLGQLHDDGSFGDLDLGVLEYYKVPAAFLVCGESSAASRLCKWIRSSGMTDEGDFIPMPESLYGYAHAYFNSWTIIGAHRLGHFDLSQRGMDFLMQFWDPESGGFYSSLTERDEETLQDLWVVSGCGQAALYTGRIDVAHGVGRWMKTLLLAQPNYPKQLFGVYSRARGVITEMDSSDEFRYVVNQDATRDAPFFNPGIAGGFLCRLYQATGEAEWLDLAKEYMRFAEGASDYLFHLLRAGKVGWATSVLYTLTGEEKYKEMAIRVGDNLIALQSEEGYWCGVEEGADEPNNDITAEMVVWLDEIHQAVGHEGPAPKR